MRFIHGVIAEQAKGRRRDKSRGRGAPRVTTSGGAQDNRERETPRLERDGNGRRGRVEAGSKRDGGGRRGSRAVCITGVEGGLGYGPSVGPIG